MTTQQPEALRLAEELDIHAHYAMNGEAFNAAVAAVAELRRLHEVNKELVAALKALVKADAPDCIKSSIWQQAFVAINKAERTTT